MKNREYEGIRVPMNLQLFAEDSLDDDELDIVDDEEIEDSEDDSTDSFDDWGYEAEEVEDEDVEEVEDAPETALQPDTPDHHAFAELRVKNNKYKELDRLFKEKFGVDGVEDYYNKLQQQLDAENQQQLTEQAEAGDVTAIVELAKAQLLNTPEFQTLRQQQAQLEAQKYMQSIEAFNNEYKSFGYEITSPESLESLPNMDKVLGMMGTNPSLDLKDAFLIVNKDLVLSQNSKVSKQKALNNVNAKRKLVTEGDGATENTAKGIDRELYNALIADGYSPKEAKAYYRKIYG